MANYLYNGVELPDVYINSSFYEEPPYRIVYREGEKYRLGICESAFSHITKDGGNYIATTGLWLEYVYRLTRWDLFGGGTSSDPDILPGKQLLIAVDSVLWTSHDILYENSTDILIAATEPILVPGTETAEPIDPTSFMQGYLLGQRLAGMRNKI